jgi:hypothetical protein
MYCSVCFDEIEVSASFCPSSAICEACLGSYIQSEIEQAKINSTGGIRCYCLSLCPVEITPEIIKNQISTNLSLTEKYEEFRLNAEVAADPTKLWCPLPNCNGVATILGPFKSKAKCDTCGQIFCSSCKQQHTSYLFPFCGSHSSSDASVAQWKSSNGGKCKKCPNCRHHIEKNGGCNHMTCTFCKYEFCWRCKSAYQGGCTAGKKCLILGFNRHHGWGQTTLSRAASKSVAYPILTGIVCAGVGTGIGLAVGVGVSTVAVGSVTILPFLGAKKLYKTMKSSSTQLQPSLDVLPIPVPASKRERVIRRRALAHPNAMKVRRERMIQRTYSLQDIDSFSLDPVDEIMVSRIQSTNTFLDSVSDSIDFTDELLEDLDEIPPVESLSIVDSTTAL